MTLPDWRVCRNLSKNCWTVQHRDYSNWSRGSGIVGRGGWNLWRSANEVVAYKVQFRVQPGGRERVRREGHNIQHAWAYADGLTFNGTSAFKVFDSISYDPFNDDEFVTDAGVPVIGIELPYVVFNRDGKIWTAVSEGGTTT